MFCLNFSPPQEVFQKRDTSRSGKLDLVELHAAVQETGEPAAHLGKPHPLPHKGWKKPRAGKCLENCRWSPGGVENIIGCMVLAISASLFSWVNTSENYFAVGWAT